MEGFNISIIGKSGVGKSSLLNYLFNDYNKAVTGTGKPQTQRGFHISEGVIDGKKVNIYDSWGLEAGKEEMWLKDFKKFQHKKQNEKNVKEWLHAVIFCISAEGKRIEDFELRILKEIKKEKLKPLLVITKADSRGAEKFARNVQAEAGLEPVLVTSVEKSKGFGDLKITVKPSGKDILMEKIRQNTGESMKERVNFLLHSKISTARARLYNKLEKTLITHLDKRAILGLVSKKDISEIQEILNRTIQSRNKSISNEVTNIANQAKVFYKETISEILNPHLAENFQMQVENEGEKFFGKLTPMTILLVLGRFNPTVTIVLALAPLLPTNITDNISAVPKTKVLQAFQKEWRDQQ